MKYLFTGLSFLIAIQSFALNVDWTNFDEAKLSVSYMKVLDNKDFIDRDLNFEKSQINVFAENLQTGELYPKLLTAQGANQEIVDVNRYLKMTDTIVPARANIAINVLNRDWDVLKVAGSLIRGNRPDSSTRNDTNLAEFNVSIDSTEEKVSLKNENIEMELRIQKIKLCEAVIKDHSRPNSELFSTEVRLTKVGNLFEVDIMGRKHSIKNIEKRMKRLVETNTDISELYLASEVEHSYLYITKDNKISIDHFDGFLNCNQH
jgi:hypothetical protein